MAQRRWAAVAEPDYDVPEILTRCVVEDWVDPWTEELQPYELGEAKDVGFWELRAWCAHGLARARWLTDNHVPQSEQCQVIPVGRTRFRDADAFAVAVAKRFPTRA